MKTSKLILLVLFVFSLLNCENMIEPEIHSQISPNDIENTQAGLDAVLNSAYGHVTGDDWGYYFVPTMASGEAWNQFGGVSTNLAELTSFNFSTTNGFTNGLWSTYFDAIRDANVVLDNIESDSFSEDFKALKSAEAKFIRGFSYSELIKKWGRVPLHTSPDQVELPRSSMEEIKTLIEQDLNNAAANLPEQRDEFGKATKGSALGVLAKYYLNTKQWEKAAQVSKQVIDLNIYDLYPNYSDMFKVENEGNEEMIWVLTQHPQHNPQNINALSFPTDFPLPNPNNAVWAAHVNLYDDFVNSFSQEDERSNLLITEYISTTSGESVQLLGNDKTKSIKYRWDPNASGQQAGNDIPVVRYSDILLTRAEALNELNGPNQESINLINQVRNRAEADNLDLANFSSKEELRVHIFQERRWEFYSESKLREDQIRHDRFLSDAQNRGINAQEHHLLFPLPQQVVDANPEVEQNPGY